MTVTNEVKIEAIANRTDGAYMHDEYGKHNWERCIRFLIDQGHDSLEIEAILCSKIMRWAKDNHGKANTTAFRVYYRDHPTEFRGTLLTDLVLSS